MLEKVIIHTIFREHCGVTGSGFFGIEFALNKVGLDAFENRGSYTMGLPCRQCEKSFPVDHIFEFLYCDEGIYFFCSKECSDKWASLADHKNESEDQQQLSI